MSVFNDNVYELFELGLSVVPVDGNTKACYKHWSAYSDRLPTDDEINAWVEESKPGDGIGLICGKASNIIGIDFDYTGPGADVLEQAILGILPPSPIAKKGGKGWTKFYKWSKLNGPKAINKKVGDRNMRVIDVLDNRLTVLPPTVHKEGMNYRYITPFTLQDIHEVELLSIDDTTINAINDLCLAETDTLMQTKEGRHDKLFGYHMIACRRARNFDEYKQMLWDYDIEMHSDNPKGPHFQDQRNFSRHGNAETFLDYEAKRWLNSYKSWLKKKHNEDFIFVDDIGDDVEIGEYQYWLKKYPSMQNNFHNINMMGKKVTDYYSLADYLIERDGIVYNEKYAMTYNGKNYENISDNQIKYNIVEACKNDLAPSNIDMTFKLLKAKSHNYLPNHPIGFINVANGILDIKNNKIIEHSPKFGFKYCTDVIYDQHASCDKWKCFLFDVLQGDMELMKLMQDMFGYVLIGGSPFLHRCFVLLGEGRNGKSTVLDVLKHLIGDANFSAVPIGMIHKPFSAIQLRGKLANIVGEISTSIIDSEAFKTAVGGEQLNMSHKGRDEFVEAVNCRFIFASNRLPNFGDTTTGTYEKLCIIPFNYYIPEKDRDPNIGSKLATELSGILNWAVDGANRVLATNQLTRAQASINELDKWRYSMDQVHRFIDECVNITGSEGDFISSKLLYNAYVQFCRSEGINSYSKSGFMRKFYENIKKLNKDAMEHRTKHVRGVKGVQIH